MYIRPLSLGDVPAFLALAAAEGWVSDPWEFSIVMDTFPRGCLAAEDGTAVAFVTAVRYTLSGWIGNLIVAKDLRGRGYGSRLMGRALEELLAAGVKTVWLTASEQGRPLYEKMGFREIDSVIRWRGTATGGGERGSDPVHLDELVALDRAGWGDDRSGILAAVAARGVVIRERGGFVAMQPCGGGFQAGPWTAVDEGVAEGLLDRARSCPGRGEQVLLDVPARNGGAARILTGAGFTAIGRTVLMYRGAPPAYVPDRIFALATMGSIG